MCTPTLNTTDADAGVWLDGTNLYQASGSFIADLPNIYGDGTDNELWDLFEDDGVTVRVTTTLEGCINAAQPQVPDEWNSYCVQCALEHVNVSDGGDGDRSMTFLIPVTPTVASEAIALQPSAGIALTGFQLASRAPVEDILANYTVAIFDDCGGHINPFDGYHYHAATGAAACNSAGADTSGHPAIMGYALDGYPIHGTLDEVNDAEALQSLDACRGHSDETYGYHYHANNPDANEHIACYTGLIAADEMGQGGPPNGPPNGEPPVDQAPVCVSQILLDRPRCRYRGAAAAGSKES